ncbi:integrase core domain-containing protein [Brachyspira pilosicoli]|uniref:Transposase n=2 Tax=Brachyspira pilosicoli TaxID=52584 RepID=A0A5C8EI11_BRAPL|nr:integrase core domain-containing protein [Brachyspira pilosicoli]TXJ37383.1 transposase [Brachyspira pilosicoli]
MKEYTSNQRKKIVIKINKVKNKEVLALKYKISIRTYYYWKSQLETYSIIKPKSTKPKNNKNKLKNKKIIKRIIEIRKLYGYGKLKIKKQLELENIKVGTTAIETVLKENNLYRSKKKKIKRKHKGKHAIYIKEAGEKVQIDVKYAFFGEIRYYQFTAVDLATRYSWREIYEYKTPSSALSFLKYVLKTSPFRIQAIQTDNGIEYTYRCINTPKINIFDEYCLKNKLERRYIPVATPRYNGVVERVHGIDEREFYSRLNKNITVELLREKLKEYTHFYNNQRLISSLLYITIKERIKNIIASKSTISMAP